MDFHRGDRIFARLVQLPGILALLVLAAIGLFLWTAAEPSIERFGLSFLSSSTWDPAREVFGTLPAVYGTLVSSFLAILIATPLSVGVALLLTELAPRRLAEILGFLVQMLAAIPSVVYGLWGIAVLVPLLRQHVEPFLGRTLGFLPLFQGPAYGVGMLAAGLILAIMIIPTISSICREVFLSIPLSQREGAMAMGATRWETMKLAVLQSAKTGIFGATILGLGRALGETMAVTMLIGNRADISLSLFAPSQTMASVIANEYAEATSTLHVAALLEVGLVLFVVTFLVNSVARLFVWRSTLRWSSK